MLCLGGRGLLRAGDAGGKPEVTAQMLPGAKLLLGLPQPFGRIERPAKAAFDVGAVWVMVFIVLVVSFSVLVGERKKEFALLRVMGTSRRKLAGILLKETLILSVSGGAAGVLMGLLVVIPFSGLIETGLKLPFLLPGIRETGWLAFAAMVVICLAGPAASAYAVLRLSRVDPATILREGE